MSPAPHSLRAPGASAFGGMGHVMPLHYPLRFSDEIALLDQVTGDRLNFASGIALLLASLIAGALWELIGPLATFKALSRNGTAS